MYKLRKTPNAVIIGRFEPVHVAHKKLIDRAFEDHEKVCIALGSARSAPTEKNPFTPEIREKMIRSCYDEAMNKRLFFVSVRDYPYNQNAWLTDIRNKVLSELDCSDVDITLVGCQKDASSFYLDLFPSWQKDILPAFKQTTLAATNIRIELFEGRDYKKDLLPGVIDIIEEFKKTDTFQNLLASYAYHKQYKDDHRFIGETAKNHTALYMTVDAVVIQSNHVLLIRRKVNPGKGLLALPGGFLNPKERLVEGMLRELTEETGIKVDKRILKANIVDEKIFDDVDRSLRGRVITAAYNIVLPPNLTEGLPRVKGDDDAEKALWVPIPDIDIRETEFFEDHASIIRYFASKL